MNKQTRNGNLPNVFFEECNSSRPGGEAEAKTPFWYNFILLLLTNLEEGKMKKL